jgi:hypothetical protein
MGGGLVFGLIVTKVYVSMCDHSSKSCMLLLVEAERGFKDMYPFDIMFLKLIKSSL